MKKYEILFLWKKIYIGIAIFNKNQLAIDLFGRGYQDNSKLIGPGLLDRDLH